MMEFWAIETEYFDKGFHTICGVDEAGRGPLAGPVIAAAVILPREMVLDDVDDSKKLSAKQREMLFTQICKEAVSYGIGLADETEIDTHNILNATYLAMNRAIENLQMAPDMCLIDGNRATGIQYPNNTIVGGDGKSISIAAASILAKVYRDRFMEKLDVEYPAYGFAKHKGYPTKAHYAALNAHGISAVHRKSFLKKWEAGR